MVFMHETDRQRQSDIQTDIQEVRAVSLGSFQLVVRSLWLMKYTSPAAVTPSSQPYGSGPSTDDDGDDTGDDSDDDVCR